MEPTVEVGEVGCTIAHLSCWRRAAGRPEKYCLILEDDAVFGQDLVEQLLDGLNQLEAAQADFDLLYLGRIPLEPDEPFIPGFVRPGYSHCTYGYLLTQRGLGVVLGAGLERMIVPVDEFLPAWCGLHPRQDLAPDLTGAMQATAPTQHLAFQGSKASLGSDTELSANITACKFSRERLAGVNGSTAGGLFR